MWVLSVSNIQFCGTALYTIISCQITVNSCTSRRSSYNNVKACTERQDTVQYAITDFHHCPFSVADHVQRRWIRRRTVVFGPRAHCLWSNALSQPAHCPVSENSNNMLIIIRMWPWWLSIQPGLQHRWLRDVFDGSMLEARLLWRPRSGHFQAKARHRQGQAMSKAY